MSEPISDAARLRYPALDRIIQHALRCSPQECVGFLLGSQHDVADILPMTNVHPCPHQAFALDPLEVARALGQQAPIVGLYHSHPNQAVHPSPLDLAGPICRQWHYWIVDPHQLLWFRLRVAAPQPG